MFKYPCYPLQYLENIFLTSRAVIRPRSCQASLTNKRHSPKELSRSKPFEAEEKAPAGLSASGSCASRGRCRGDTLPNFTETKQSSTPVWEERIFVFGLGLGLGFFFGFFATGLGMS